MGGKYRISNVEIFTLAASCKSRYEFIQKSPSIAKAARRKNLMDVLFPKVNDAKTVEELIEIISYFPSRRDAHRWCNKIDLKSAKRLGVLDIVFGCLRVLDEKTVRKAASMFDSRSEFWSLDGAAYNKACTLGLLDELFPEKKIKFDSDSIYIWRAVGVFFDGIPVYKIGLTGSHRGLRRIKHVAKVGGFKYELICCEKVAGDATDLERKLHILGENPGYSGFDGATEFRALSDSALYAAVSLICNQVTE